jgi:GT2 family glycosyltransferase
MRVWLSLILLLPFDLLVGASLLLASLLRKLTTHKSAPQHLPASPNAATIQILNWDGKHLLEECLPSVIAAVRKADGDHRILVVDNGSRDGSVAFVRASFPEVRVLELDRNYGFVGGNNRGVQTIDTDIVVLLNNDMIVDPDFLRPLLAGFTDPSVFAVTSQIFFEDRTRRREETGKTSAVFEHGFFSLAHDPIDSSLELVQTFLCRRHGYFL